VAALLAEHTNAILFCVICVLEINSESSWDGGANTLLRPPRFSPRIYLRSSPRISVLSKVCRNSNWFAINGVFHSLVPVSFLLPEIGEVVRCRVRSCRGEIKIWNSRSHSIFRKVFAVACHSFQLFGLRATGNL